MKKDMKFLIINLIIVIMVILSGVGCIVYATSFGNELVALGAGPTNKYNEGYTEDASYSIEMQYTYAGEKHDVHPIKDILDELNGSFSRTTAPRDAELKFEAVLSQFGNAFCIQHGAAIPNGGVSCSETGFSSGWYQFQPAHGTVINPNDYIVTSGTTLATLKYSEPLIEHNGYYSTTGDHSDTSTFKTQTNNIAVIVASGNLKNIGSSPIISHGGFLSYSNIAPYAATFADKWDGTEYTGTKAQKAIWNVTGPKGAEATDFYYAGLAVDYLENELLSHGDRPEVTMVDSEQPGAVYLEGTDTYRVGPFHMSDYAYVYSPYVINYSGRDLARYKGLVGGIEDGQVILADDSGKEQPLEIGKDGVNIVYEDFYGKLTSKGDSTRKSSTGICTEYLPSDYEVYPYPDSVFYIDIPRSLTYGDDSTNRTDDDKTTLSKLQFTYRKTTTDGSVTSFTVAACPTEWKRENGGAACSNTLCQAHYQTAGHCTSSCHDDDDGGTCHHDCTGPAYYCSSHHHHDCQHANWKAHNGDPVEGQRGGLVNDSNVTVWHKNCISTLNVRLTTDIVIKKYVEKVEHETNKYATFGDTSSTSVKNSTQNPNARKDMNNDERKDDPIYAEYGDVITFRIDIMNNQNYKVKLKLKDILPKEIDVFSRTYKTDSNKLWKDYQWISVDGNDTTSLLLTLRTNANNDELYYNEIVIVTRNSSLDKNEDDNVDFMRAEDRRVGPVVNISEIDSTKIKDEYGTDIPEDIFSTEYYKINDYNVVIDKYISDYKHEMMDNNNSDKEKITKETFASDKLKESDDPSNKPERFEKQDIDKQRYPVPVEKTETLTYSVRIINNSKKDGNKVATEIRPQKITDKLNKGLEFISDGSGYKINAEIHNDVGTDKESNISLTQGVDYEVKYDSSENSIDIELKDTQNGEKTDENATYLVIQPGGYLLYEIEVKVIESNMNLNILENTASIEIMNNINNGKDRTGSTVACDECQGTGNTYEYQTCGVCGGTGTASKEGYCSNCSGRGIIYTHTDCDQCGGDGRIKTSISNMTVYVCEDCGTIHVKKPSPTCNTKLPNIICNNTSFDTICNICGKKQGQCEHVIWICSAYNHQTHEKDNGNVTSCGYKETHTSFDHYYKCSETGCKTADWNITSCPAHPNANLTFVKSKCKNDNCNAEFTTKTTSHIWTCTSGTTKYCNSSSHGIKEYGDCTHFKYECTKCKKKYANYPNKPTSCSNCYTKICTGKKFKKVTVDVKKLTQDEYAQLIDLFYKDCTKCGGNGYIESYAPCTACSGGRTTSGGTITCSTCEGRGKSIVATSKPCTDGCSNGRKPDTETSDRIVRNKTWYSGIDSNKNDINRNMYAYKIPSEYVDYKNTPYIDYDGDGDNEISSDYVRMKDLVISGYVWLDADRDGYMNESNIDEQNQAYYNVNDKGAKENVVVRLYSVTKDPNDKNKNIVNLVRTTRTDERGRYTFSNYYSAPNTLTWYKTYKSESFENYADVGSRPDGDSNVAGVVGTNTKPYLTNSKDDLEHTTQRIDKATNKDEYGNYTNDSEYIDYYIEFEYDGVVYKSTEYYSGMDNLIDTQGDTYGQMSGIEDPRKYKIDSNAAEFNDVREKFNQSYQYISYDVGYSSQGQQYIENDPKAKLNQTISPDDGSITFSEVGDNVGNPLTTADLMFDKTNHTSQLVENQNRAMTARSFIKNTTLKDLGEGKPEEWGNNDIKSNSLGNTNLLWLFNYREEYQDEDKSYITPNSAGANPKHTTTFNKNNPDTEYLKYINLGLELRENVDITLTKDVYSVNTLINGEDMEYFFNQNRAFNAEVGDKKGDYLNDYIIAKPYGLELYESDYKMRVDQYASQAVKTYKGSSGESELNTEVTYRITVANKAINDDESLNSEKTKDTKLKVRISEILDLYDTNFKKYNSDADVVPVKRKDDNGYLIDGTIKVAEAWYFEQKDDGEYIIANESGNAKVPGTYGDGYQSTEKPIYVKVSSIDQETIGDKPRYTKHMLTLSNTSMKGNGVSNKENRNNFENDGYYTLYITGMENDNNLILEEGKDFDIYVKYVLDKADSETTLTTDDYEYTINDTATTEGGNVVDIKGTKRGSSAILKRTLKILDKITKPEDTRRGLEGIAQVNMYSVWYADSGKATGLVDMDSNAGNLGNTNSELKDKLFAKESKDSTKKNEILNEYKNGNPDNLEVKCKKNDQTSADTWNPYYEDMTYKTGIVITAEGSELNKQKVKEIYGELEIQENKMIRELTGKVWDDSRSDEIAGTDNGSNDKQYLGNGKYSKDDKKTKLALANKNVPENYDNNQAIEGKTQKPNEEQDIKVRNVKAELIEIVEIPAGNGKSSYYEEVLSNVTWEQAQHIRTKATGDYKLTGFIPGKYIVRFTYGDTIEDKDLTNAEKDFASETIKYAAADMQVFNGQDYKTTKYAYNLSDYNKNDKNGKTISTEGGTQVGNVPVNSGTIDQYAAGIVSDSDALSKNDVVMLALERPDLSDARDDEIRRLEVNNYSEIMVNEKAEVLKGLANNTQLSTQQLGGERDKVTGEITKEGDVSVNYYKNYSKKDKDDNLIYENDYKKALKTLTDKTNMNAETVEFLVKPEKLTYQQTNEKEYYTKLKASSKDYYYNDLDTIVHSIITERTYKIENIDMGIEYRPETNISLGKEIDQILLVSSDQKVLANLKLYTEIKKEGNSEKVIHHIDMENSTGADKVQFVSNTYEVDKLLEGIVNIHEEHGQGLLYVAVDEELLQGCKVIVQYKFTAQNNSEVDRISKKLNKIRFYGNEATKALSNDYQYDSKKLFNDICDEDGKVLGKEYTANNLAKNKTYDAVYQKDGNGDIYRNRPKTMVEDSVNGSRSSSGYFGDYVGYTYYTGNDSKGLDTIAEMKFDRLIDYVDTDLEYVQLTDYEGKLLDTDGKTIMQNPEEQTSLLQNVSKVAENARTTKFLTSSVLQDDTTDTTNNNTTVDNSTEENTEVEDNAGTVPTEDNKKPELFDVLTDSTSDVSANDDKFWVTVSPPNNASTTNPGDTSGGIDYGIGGQERLFNLQMKQRIFRLGAPWSKEYFNEIMVGGQKDENKDDDNAVEYESSSILDVLVDMRGIQYKSLVMTIADKKSDNDKENKNRQFSKFLSPRVVAEAKEGFNKNNEQTDDSKAIIYLPVSKVLASETNTENMLYENIAEVIQFTVLTGRRTNFDTTIGNADIHVVHEQNPKEVTETVYPYEKYGSIEFVTAALEKDTSSTELITLTPPTGLMKNRRAIFEAMETTRDVLKITVIAVAVVVVAIVVTKFTMVKIKKRRYK